MERLRAIAFALLASTASSCVTATWIRERIDEPVRPAELALTGSLNFTSTKVKDVYVLGDATIAAEMPKSAFSANSQAKVVAADILAILAKKPKFSPNFRNTCWSMLAPDDSVKIGAGYVPKGLKLDPVAPFVSKPGEDAALRKQVFQESLAWYSGIVDDVFAKSAKKKKA